MLALIVAKGGALIAYDCRDPAANISTISIRDVAPCPDPATDYHTRVDHVQIIQRWEFGLAHVHVCLVEVTQLMYHCGMFSHLAPVEQGIHSNVYQVGATECANMHRYHTYKGFHGVIFNELQPNSTVTSTITIVGGIGNAKCSGGTYSYNGNTWDDVVVQANVKITIKDYQAIVKLESNIHRVTALTSRKVKLSGRENLLTTVRTKVLIYYSREMPVLFQ